PWDFRSADADYAPHIAGLLAGTAGLDVPDDLRGRVLTALAGSAAEERLLAPPPAPAISAALAEIGADTLVYLLPSADGQPGRAVLMPASGNTGDAPRGPLQIPLPELRARASGPLREYAKASAAVLSGPVGTAEAADAGNGTGQADPPPEPGV